jgi:hypothetical protein
MNSEICISQGFKGECSQSSGYYPYYCEASKKDLSGFAFQNQDLLSDGIKIAPLVLGSLCCLYSGIAIFRSEENQNKLSAAFSSITPRAEESQYAYLQRIAPIALTILGIGAFATAELFLPSDLSSGIIAIGATSISSLYMQGSEWMKNISSCEMDIKKLCRKWFLPQDNSTLETCRVVRNMGRILAGLGVAAVSIWWMSDIQNIIEDSSTYDMALPGQSSGFVFLEYFLFAAAHLDQSFTYFMNSVREGNSSLLNGYTWFHGLSAGITAALPFIYIGNDLRIHHTLLGSGFMLLPFKGLQFLGLSLLSDGLNYRFNNSGFNSYYCNAQGTHFQEIFNPFGLDNVAANNFFSIFSYTAIGCCLERMAASIQKALQAFTLPVPPQEYLNPLHQPLTNTQV